MNLFNKSNLSKRSQSLIDLPFSIKFFIFGAGLSAIGNATFRMSVFWYVSNILQSPTMTTLIGVMLFLPAFFMAPLAGWLSDKYTNARISALLQFIAACLLFIIANIQNLDLSVYILLPIAFIQSLLSLYSSSFNMAYCRNSLSDEEMSFVIKIMSIVSSAAMVVGPMVVAIPLKAQVIPFESIFYFNAFTYIVFSLVLVTLPSLKMTKKQIGLLANFVRTTSVITSTVKIRNAFIAFLSTNFAYGGIAVALPLVVNNSFGNSAGSLYGSLEVVGGGVALASSILLKNMKINHLSLITALAMSMYIISYLYLSELTLYALVICVFSFSVIQVIKTNIIIISEADKGLAGSLNSLLIMGGSVAAAISSLTCYVVVLFGSPSLCFIISAGALLIVFKNQKAMQKFEQVETT